MSNAQEARGGVRTCSTLPLRVTHLMPPPLPPPALRSTLSTAIVCGSLSVFASIAMIDRVPGAGVAGTCSRDWETGMSIDSGKE